MRRLVIVESPLGTRPDGTRCTPDEMSINVEYALKCVRDCFRRGEAPFASHVFYPLVLDDTVPEERQMGMEAGFAWAKAATALAATRVTDTLAFVAVYVDNGITDGMKKGIAKHEASGLRFEYRKLYPEPHTLTPSV